MMTVIELQKALARLGFDVGPADGIAGARTQAALRAFQQRYGLKVDGVVGPATRAALGQALAGLARPPDAAPAAGGAAPAPGGGLTLDKRSQANLVGVHPDLVAVVEAALQISPITFVVTEGLRTLARQRSLVASGASQSMKSRHLTGHAVDLAAKINGVVRWDWPLYAQLAKAMKTAAAARGTPLEWGGDWRTLKDGPHFQLPWSNYPT